MIHRYSAIVYKDGKKNFVNLDSICILKRGEEIKDGNTVYIICCETAVYSMDEYRSMMKKRSSRAVLDPIKTETEQKK